jgi:hypothetical protein
VYSSLNASEEKNWFVRSVYIRNFSFTPPKKRSPFSKYDQSIAFDKTTALKTNEGTDKKNGIVLEAKTRYIAVINKTFNIFTV